MSDLHCSHTGSVPLCAFIIGLFVLFYGVSWILSTIYVEVKGSDSLTHYPHHCAVIFGHQGKYLWEVLKYMGIPVDEIDYNFPKGVFYPTENPFA